MKNRLFLLVCFLMGAFYINAQTTTIPSFRTVQVKPGVIRVPAYKLPAVTTTRISQKVLESEEIKAVTAIAPTEANFMGSVEVSVVTPKFKVELTPMNFTSTEKARLYLRYPLGIGESGFTMGDIYLSPVKDINLKQYIGIDFEAIAGKQYNIRIPVNMMYSKTRTLTVYYGGVFSKSALFSCSFAGLQDVSFNVTAETTGWMLFTIKETSAYQSDSWTFSKVIISEL